MVVALDGWWLRDGAHEKWDAQWFVIKVPPTETWAYKDGSSQRRIAALELMGTIIITKLIHTHGSGAIAHLTTPIATDNKGNAYNIAKDKARQPALLALMMELAISSHQAHTQLGAYHVKRAHNTWADALADKNYSGFDPKKRLRFDIKDEKNWHIWTKLKRLDNEAPPPVKRTGAGTGTRL